MFDSKNFWQLAAAAVGVPPAARGRPNAVSDSVETTTRVAKVKAR
jgi:hypothetical protein